MLELKNLSVNFADRAVLKDIDLSVPCGSFIAIVGSNGAGKSTLFQVISGLLKPLHGQVIVDGQDITGMPPYHPRRASLLTSVLQDPRVGTMSHLSLEENLCLALKRARSRGFWPAKSPERRAMFGEKLALLGMGLEYRLDQRADTLSGGQRQALSLIMSLLGQAKVWLLDEITAALDPEASQRMLNLVQKIVKEEKRTTLMISHNFDHARLLADRVYELTAGRLVLQ